MCVRIVESEPMTSVVGVAAGAGAASFSAGRRRRVGGGSTAIENAEATALGVIPPIDPLAG